jgi:hypothetical protein
MQWWGTEYRRAQDPEYWVKKAEQVILQDMADGVDASIWMDLRFKNEYALIGNMGGWRIKISRLGYVSNVPQHVSETELQHHPFDLHIGVGEDLPLLEDMARHTYWVLSSRHTRLPDFRTPLIEDNACAISQ